MIFDLSSFQVVLMDTRPLLLEAVISSSAKEERTMWLEEAVCQILKEILPSLTHRKSSIILWVEQLN